MPISIKNEEVERLARDVAKLTGESLTDAIRVALAERETRLRRAKSGKTLIDELNEIVDRYNSRPIVSNLTDDELLGYDEFGAPTR